MDAFELRTAVAADAEELRSLVGGVAQAPRWSVAVWRELLEAQGDRFVRVAFAGGEAAGVIVARDILGVVELESIAVREAMQRRGIGGRMLRSLAAWADKRDAQAIELEVRASNAGACGLYRSCGGIVVGLRRAYYRAPVEDALLFRLPVSGK